MQKLFSYGILYLVDVRSMPYSKWAPDFNRETLRNSLKKEGIIYGYLGDSIGGKPTTANCYDSDGRYDYRLMALSPRFQSGLKRLMAANDMGLRVAVMCSESDPSVCHRSKLIGSSISA